MKRYYYIIFSILTIAMVFSVVPAFGNSPEKAPAIVGAKAPCFTVFDLEGNEISLEALINTHKAVVINFWGLRCGACIEEMPHLNDMYRRYGNEIIILGINVDAVDGEFLNTQINKSGLSMEYEVVPDPEFTMVDMFGLTAAPLTIVIDSEGVIRYRHENYVPGDEKKLQGVIQGLLDGKKVVVK